MNIVQLSSYRRHGGLRREQVWVERSFPDRHWVIAAVLEGAQGQRRVVIEPLEDRTSEAVYSEAYFRRHFIDRNQWLRMQNERLARQARRKNASQLLHEMTRMNAKRPHGPRVDGNPSPNPNPLVN